MADNDAIVKALTDCTQSIVESLGALTAMVSDLKASVEDLAASTESGHNEVAIAINDLTEKLKQD